MFYGGACVLRSSIVLRKVWYSQKDLLIRRRARLRHKIRAHIKKKYSFIQRVILKLCNMYNFDEAENLI